MSTNVAAAESHPAVVARSLARRGAYLRAEPIMRGGNAIMDQSPGATVTAIAKYSPYISRPVATANYPQLRAGSQRNRTDSVCGAGA